MAEKGFTPVSVHPLFTAQALAAGQSATSRVIDLRYVAQRGKFAMATSLAGGTSTTCGTTGLTYLVGIALDSTFAAPTGTSATIGTYGSGNTWAEFNPVLTPFIQIVATQTGAGGAGAQTKVTAALIAQ